MPGTALRLRFIARPDPPALGRVPEEGLLPIDTQGTFGIKRHPNLI